MRIMVFDVPAENCGALSILNSFYNEYKKDSKNEYIFVVSRPELQDTSNIKVLRFPWIKKSWVHRIYFDHFIAPKLIKKYRIDKVLSLQNTVIPHTKVYQSVFVHNALPFSEYRFSLFNNILLWLYQNIIGRCIFKSIKRADRVFVQTKCMKQKCVSKLNIDDEKVDVIPTRIQAIEDRKFKGSKESFSTFFYPANGMPFKNHKLIVDACIKLKEEGIEHYKVFFTLKGNENKNVMKLYKQVYKNKLPIKFLGSISGSEVHDFYSRSVLIFPSYVETVGLPLLEAKSHGTPIIASNNEYAKEILYDYEKIYYFNTFDVFELTKIMKSFIESC